MTTRRIRLFLPLLAALAGLTGIAGLASHAAAPKESKKDAKDEKPKWDVMQPPGEWSSITIDTTETTWTSLDVSPDGRTIVFDMLGDLFTVAVGGGDAKALTSGIASDFQPRFSPDGKRVVFVSDRDGADNLWTIGADGANPLQLTKEKEHLVHNPSWSPDGEWVVARKDFTSTRSIPAGEIWLFHAAGGEGLQITERPNGPKDQKTFAEPAFSADGRRILYSQDITPGQVWQYNKDSTGSIFAIKAIDRQTGKTDVVVGGPGGAIAPRPSPDGKRLAFVRRTPALTSALFVKDMASGVERSVYDRLDRDFQETNGSEGNTPAYAWTPDGGALVFWSAGQLRRVDVATKASTVIPVRVKSTMKVAPALRFPVAVAPDTVKVRMLRWAQMSPDGKRVVFQALGHLYVRDVAAGTQKRLTTQTDHFEFHPSFSLDGRSVVYTTWDDQDSGSLRLVSIDGGAARTLTSEPGLYVEPRFSPDGKLVVYRKVASGYLLPGTWSMEPGLYVVPVAGGDVRRVSRDGATPHFAAGSDRVLFTQEHEETQLVLKSVDLNGMDERTHLKGAKATEFSVSPDGRWVAFTESWNAWVAPFTLTGRTVDIGSEAKGVAVRQVSKRSGEFLHWSADSRRLHWANGATLFSRELKDAFSNLEGAPAELPPPVETGLDLAFEQPADVPEGRIALTGARIVTMRDASKGQEVIEDGVLVVRGNRIEAVGPRDRVQVPADAKVIDVAGRTILPGLVDVHAHGTMSQEEIIPEQNWMQFSNLAFGVTTVHDPSNDTSSVFAASEMQRTGQLVGPRLFSTGTILYGAHAPGYTAGIGTLEDAQFHVRRLRDVGAISVKSYQQPRRDQRQQVIAAARELGMMVVPEGGARWQHNLTMIVDGHTGIEHAIPLITGYDDVKQLWSQSGTGYTPTLGVAYGGISGENYWYDRTEVWKNERLMRYTPRAVLEPRAIRRGTAPDLHYNHVRTSTFAKALRDRGVSVQIGAHGQREGLAAHWELWMLEQGGFSPWEALRAGTIDGARYVGLDRDLGSLETGKLADLFVVDGNPLTDLKRSEFVVYTMVNGRLYEAKTMNQVAPDAVARQPFYFEKEGGDTIHPAATEAYERFRRDHGWVH